jgi:flagellin
MVGIKANVNALNASVKLSGNAMEQTTAMQRLGTGARVNSAKDDTVALAVSTGLIAQIKGMAAATRNVADGISLAQTAESALASVVTILQHMRELTLQAANGTLSSQNRQTMELEFDQNINQINHVLETSHFNGIKLFDGSALSLQIQSGANLNNINNISIPKINTFSLLGATPTRDDKSNEILAPEINLRFTFEVQLPLTC